MKLAPIVLFTYNRPWHTKQTIEALKKNTLAMESELIIYSDGAKNDTVMDDVKNVREYIKTVTGFKKLTIIERDKNWGLAASIIDGVTDIVNKYGKIIVLEDDLVTGAYFLQFLNDGLNLYEGVSTVGQIMGYSYFEKYIDKYELSEQIFIKGADCLGWGTWKDRWALFNSDASVLISQISSQNKIREFNWNNSYNYYNMLLATDKGVINSWAIRWYASAFLNNLYTLYPSRSLVLHIGNDGSGTNYSLGMISDPLNVPIFNNRISIDKMEVLQSKNNEKAYCEFLLQYKSPLWKRILRKINKYCLMFKI